MSFQIPTTTTAAANSGFSFGLTSTPAAAAKPPSFTFGATGGGDAGAMKPLSFGAPTTTTTAAPAATGFGSSFLAPTTTPATTAAPPATGFSFGAAPATAPIPTAAVAPAATTTSAAATGFSFSAAAPPAAAPTATVAATTAPPAAAAPTPAFTLTAAAAPVAVPAKTTAPAPALSAIATSTAAPGGFANLSTATKTTDSAAVANTAQFSYNQLEEHINKWTLELEEQEKVFIDQATQINAWDKVLIGNNQKILELNDAVQKVKSDQQTLEQELEFIATQHKELEESIVPLQKEFMKLPQVDVERSQTYLLVENLDTQLKQMSEDLKEIIDNLNEATKGQDNTDPIIQIGKILNAHMGSLQWIESSSTNIANKLDDITKMHESFKRESERSFRSAYYH